MSDLTVVSVVENDLGLLDLMIRSARKFAETAPKFIICDNGNNGVQLNKYANDNDIKVVKNKPTIAGGSNRHGEGLNVLLPLVETKLTAIIESDCVILNKGWDQLNLPTTKMLAAKKGELAGQPYYHACFMVFATSILKHDGVIDFRPGKDGNRSNRPYKPHEDVAWRIREKVRTDQIKLLNFIDCKKGDGIYFDESFQSDEIWLDNLPIVAHFGRGSNLKGKAIRKNFDHPEEQLKKWKKIAEAIIGN